MQNLDFTAYRGQLIAVVGDVGSGKSSFLSILLGQMKQVIKEEGNEVEKKKVEEKSECKVFGSISYVPQEAWLLNMTLRDNIIFGTEYDEAKYKQVIKVWHFCYIKWHFLLYFDFYNFIRRKKFSIQNIDFLLNLTYFSENQLTLDIRTVLASILFKHMFLSYLPICFDLNS